MIPPTIDPSDFTKVPPEQLEAAIAAQNLEIQRLFKVKDFGKMPEAQHRLAQLKRARVDLRHRQPV